MIFLKWQDGFEGAEVLSAVYDSVGLGSAIVVGQGRSGGNALQGRVTKDITSFFGSIHDPVIVGIARIGSLGGSANIELGDTHGDVASLAIDVLGRVAVNLPTMAGSPTLVAPIDPRINATWRYIEWYHVSDVTGRVIVYVDGVKVIDFSGSTCLDPTRGAAFCTVGGNGTIDDFYVGLPTSESDFFGDYVVTGLAPGATGSVPALGDVTVDQQYIDYANVAPVEDVTVDQQYIIVAIKNKAPSRVRPQVFGVGR